MKRILYELIKPFCVKIHDNYYIFVKETQYKMINGKETEIKTNYLRGNNFLIALFYKTLKKVPNEYMTKHPRCNYYYEELKQNENSEFIRCVYMGIHISELLAPYDYSHCENLIKLTRY